jgi:antitoxin component of MazEF toxin-antitoxin module
MARRQQARRLAVVDIPAALVADLGGRRQMRVTGNLNGAAITGSTMLVAGGGPCVGVSKAALKAANAAIGDEVELSITT